jgi:hypothetical protein
MEERLLKKKMCYIGYHMAGGDDLNTSRKHILSALWRTGLEDEDWENGLLWKMKMGNP